MEIVDKSFGARLQGLVDDLGMGTVEKHTGVTRATIYKWISGDNRPPLFPLVQLCRASGKTVEWLVSGGDLNGTDSSYELIPRLNVRAALGPGFDVDQEQIVGHLAFSKSWLKYKNLDAKKCLLIKASGESMSPTIHSNDVCLVNIIQNKPKDGNIYALSVHGSAKIKRIVFKMDGSIILRSDNETFQDEVIDHESMDALKVVGKVVWFARDIS